MKITVFRVVALCSLVEVDRRFRGTYCLHHQGVRPLNRRLISMRLHGATTQKTAIFIVELFFAFVDFTVLNM
jgi:hypothetical protein